MRIYINVNGAQKKISYKKLDELENYSCILPIHKPYADAIRDRKEQPVIVDNWRGTFEAEPEVELDEEMFTKLITVAVKDILDSYSFKEVNEIFDEDIICSKVQKALPVNCNLSLHGMSYVKHLSVIRDGRLSEYIIPLMPPQMQKEKEKEMDR